jgi:cold shock CspA family protein
VGSRALAAGGATAYVEMPLNAHPPTLDAESFNLKLAAAKASSLVDFGLWGGLVPGNVARLEELAKRGVVGFKAFTSNSGMNAFEAADDLTLYEGMQRAAELGLPVLVHTENDQEHWAGVESVVVKIAEDSIVLEADRGDTSRRPGTIAPRCPPLPLMEGPGKRPKSCRASGGASSERGRVKWFDAEKGYGFLVRPTGEDIFVHHSEVRSDPSSITANDEVEYEVGHNDRGPVALAVEVTEKPPRESKRVR